MNDNDKQIAREAAKKLLAWADGATLEWVYDGTRVDTAWPQLPLEVLGGDKVRIRQPASPPEPKPSPAVLEACKRLGVEAWKLANYKAGDNILQNGCVSGDVCSYGIYASHKVYTCKYDQECDPSIRYWHVRPVAQTAPPSLQCPPRPTEEQVAAARMPDGRKVKPPTVCEVPNGRAYFADNCERVYIGECSYTFGGRRWIAEPAEDVVTPWTLDPKHAGKVVVRKGGAGWGMIVGVRDCEFIVTGWGKVAPDALLRDWTHNGRPCGDV